MPLEVIVSESAKSFAERIDFDPSGLIRDILGTVPRADLLGLAKVVVAEIPPRKKVRNPQALASYYRAFNGNPARVEIYIHNAFGYLKGPESLALMLPFAQIGLAGTLFHEVGHHVQHTRSHGVHRGKAE